MEFMMEGIPLNNFIDKQKYFDKFFENLNYVFET